jgi:hypothetical protein
MVPTPTKHDARHTSRLAGSSGKECPGGSEVYYRIYGTWSSGLSLELGIDRNPEREEQIQCL